jgi:hypothetical protein
MAGWEEYVERTIRAPEEIRQAVGMPKRWVFYRGNFLPAPYEQNSLRVVVEYPTFGLRGLRRAKVITAFPSNGGKQGEALIWQP